VRSGEQTGRNGAGKKPGRARVGAQDRGRGRAGVRNGPKPERRELVRGTRVGAHGRAGIAESAAETGHRPLGQQPGARSLTSPEPPRSGLPRRIGGRSRVPATVTPVDEFSMVENTMLFCYYQWPSVSLSLQPGVGHTVSHAPAISPRATRPAGTRSKKRRPARKRGQVVRDPRRGTTSLTRHTPGPRAGRREHECHLRRWPSKLGQARWPVTSMTSANHPLGPG